MTIEAGEPWEEAMSRNDLAHLRMEQGDFAEAAAELARAEAVATRLERHSFALAVINCTRAMTVLLDDGLLVFQARPIASLNDTSVPVRCCLLHLNPATVGLEVTERFEDRPDSTGAIKPTRVHLWQLHTEALDLRIDGAEVVHAGVETGPDPNEQLGRAIAAKLGWELP